MSCDRTTMADLARLLADSAAPIYVLDEDRRIVFCNAACAQWVGLAADDLVGQQCIYHSPGDDSKPSAVAAGLCPPPKVFAGQVQTATVSCTAPDGTLVWRRGHFVPLSDGQDESAEVLAVLDTNDCGPAVQESASDAQLHEQVRRFRAAMTAHFRLDGLIGASPAIVRVRAQIELAACCDAHVLVAGPRGSGKDHVAKSIHHAQRERGHLVPLDCGVLDANLLRATLRAVWLKHSALKGAASILLADVDAAPPELQSDLVELLRVNPHAVRVIATAQRPLDELGEEGRFSRQLACGLSTISIQLPPLCERIQDLPLLAQAFLEQVNATSIKQVGGFTSEAIDRLTGYNWPGNIDELAGVVRRAHEAAQGGEVAMHDLPSEIHRAAGAAAHPARNEEVIDLEEFLGRLEVELITRALRRAKGNKSKAARLLGLTRPRLYRRLVQLGLEQPPDKKQRRAD